MTENEIAYVAGLLEGEGCFDYNASNVRYPRVRCESTDRDVIYWLRDVIGGRVHTPTKQQPHHKQSYMWVLNGREKVEPLLRDILPWLKSRRAAKVRLLLRSYD